MCFCDKNCCGLFEAQRRNRKVDGYYEHIRDSKKYPCCWNSIDNTCLAHFHSSIEIVYVTEGEVEYTFNGQSGMVHPHQVVLAPSYTIHYYSTVSYTHLDVYKRQQYRLPDG